jgi:hypothetical protein
MKKQKKENIGNYYKDNLRKSDNSESEVSITDFESSPSTFEEEKKFARSLREPKRKIMSGMDLTKTADSSIEPGKMKKRAPCTLKQVCDENNYNLSIQDFEEEKIMIGKGSFGEVYLVQCRLNKVKYALKVLNKERVQNFGCERHLLREKDITSMLDHPNICRLEAYFMDNENCYFLFELCQVGDLNSFIKDNGKLSLKLTRLYAMEIVSAIEHLRYFNIVHRDLKPK